MANEQLQKLGHGSSRSIITGAPSVEERELIINKETGVKSELITKYDDGTGVKEFHYPSQERLGIGLPTVAEVIDSGAHIISVKHDFGNLSTTPKTLVAILAEIDVLLSAPGQAITDDGKKPMLEHWNTYKNINVGNVDNEFSPNQGGSNLNVLGESGSLVFNANASNGDVFSSGDSSWTDDGNMSFINSAWEYDGSIASSASISSPNVSGGDFLSNEWYVFSYDIIALTGEPVVEINEEFAYTVDGDEEAIELDLSYTGTLPVTKKILIKTASRANPRIQTLKLFFSGTNGDTIRINNFAIDARRQGSLYAHEVDVGDVLRLNSGDYSFEKAILEIVNQQYNTVSQNIIGTISVTQSRIKFNASDDHNYEFTSEQRTLFNKGIIVNSAGNANDPIHDFSVNGTDRTYIRTDSTKRQTEIYKLVPMMQTLFVDWENTATPGDDITITEDHNEIIIDKFYLGNAKLILPAASNFDMGKVIWIYNTTDGDDKSITLTTDVNDTFNLQVDVQTIDIETMYTTVSVDGAGWLKLVKISTDGWVAISPNMTFTLND
jgi:hypothetical protein